MKPQLDHFYRSARTGVFKFIGYRENFAMLEKYEKSDFTGKYGGWISTGVIHTSYRELERGLKEGRIRPIPPPQ